MSQNPIASIDIAGGNGYASYVPKAGEKVDRVILLYSGGLDTSCMIPWIKEKYGCEVYALTVDMGQQVDDFNAIREKAYRLGAREHFLVDAKERLVRDYAFRAVRANARVGKNGHPISSSLTRPLIVEIAAGIAQENGVRYFAHGASGQSNDSVRFDTCILALAPDAKIIAPVREWSMSRADEIEYARLHDIPVSATHESPFSIDDNIWGVEIEAGPLTDIGQRVPNGTYKLVNDAAEAPDIPYHLSLGFKGGIPIKLNDNTYDPVDLVRELNRLGAEHGIGRFDCLEDRAVGVKVRELHESPAAHILMTAYADLEYACPTPDSLRIKNYIDYEWANMMLGGKCFDPAINALNSAIDSLASDVTGSVHMQLYKGGAIITYREYVNSLDLGSLIERRMLPNGVNQRATACFIEASSLPIRAAHNRKK